MPVGEDGYRLPTVHQNDTKKLETLPREHDDYCRTFVLNNEDHTIGNTLKYIIMQNPDTQFCGYTVPHPMENKIHIRIQSVNQPAVEILRIALKELKAQNEAVLRMVKKGVKEYEELMELEL